MTEPAGAATKQALLEIKKKIGPKVRICILGGTSFHGEDSEALVKELAGALARKAGERASFVTGGMDGVQKTFALNCGDGKQVYNLLPVGEASNYGVGTDLNAGANLDERKEIFGQLGHIYLTVEGGKGVSMEATAAVKRGASVVPLIRSGGASSGLMDFPSEALQQPKWATAEEWELLAKKDAPVAESAEAAASMVARLMSDSATSTMAVTAQKNAAFYMGALASFLRGTTDKMPVEALTITAVGRAINTAVAVAARAELEQLGEIVSISTALLGAESAAEDDEDGGKKGSSRERGGPQVRIVMKQGLKTC